MYATTATTLASLLRKVTATSNAAKMHINPRVIEAQYAVRGLIPLRAGEIEKELQRADGAAKYPFDSLVYCNIGNPQALKQKPLTFFRQVMSLIDAPFLLDNPAAVSGYPSDAVERAKLYLSHIGDKTGAYTDSMGYMFARNIVADYINERDHHIAPAAQGEDIILTDGASTGVRLLMQALVGGNTDAVMIPIPQYPLYTAQIALLGGTPALYYLREASGWGMIPDDLNAVYKETQEKSGATPRLLVVINPGNPTGTLLSREVMEAVVKFCCDKGVVLLADEVYQENIYADGARFTSFREVMHSLPAPYNTKTMLASLHSTSKGIIGECGRRGGFTHLENFPAEFREQLLKLCSINLCSNVNGQIMTALMCSAPKPGDASYETYRTEYSGIFNSLRSRAALLAKELATIQGFSCNPVEGAMYAFPRIRVPDGYTKHNDEENAKEGRNLAVDARWALELLEASGIVVVPGSGFGQEPGTLHFRTTILPPMDQMERMVKAIRTFQDVIYAKYA